VNLHREKLTATLPMSKEATTATGPEGSRYKQNFHQVKLYSMSVKIVLRGTNIREVAGTVNEEAKTISGASVQSKARDTPSREVRGERCLKGKRYGRIDQGRAGTSSGERETATGLEWITRALPEKRDPACREEERSTQEL